MQLALVMETRNMANLVPRGAQNARKRRNGTNDTLQPYRSSFTRDSWTLRQASGRCVCNACHDGFNSVKAFDKHQVLNSNGDVICRDPATLGMVRNATGWWITEAREIDGEEQAS